MKSQTTDVLIVGAGPTGLAAAIELGSRGIAVQVVERNERAGVAPRAKTTNVRTRTHLRRWGIANRLAELSPFGVDYPNDMIYVTSLKGYKLAHFENAFNAAPERSELYPEHAQWIPQYKLEQVLLEKARSLPSVHVRFNTEFVVAEQSEERVSATIRGSEQEEVIHCKFLIGADGARSVVRREIGAEMLGQSGLSYSYNIIFKAPGMDQSHSFGPAAMYLQAGKDGLSAVGPMDKDDVWFMMPVGLPEGTTLSDEQAKALIKSRTGIDLPIEILSADQWNASNLIADKYREGRIFLAGDACHLHPPTGGYGMNMGVGDGVDLGWKIAAVIQGWGGQQLLGSYESERRPVHRFVIDEAVANFGAVPEMPPQIEDDSEEGQGIRDFISAVVQETKGREYHTLGTVLGLGYENSPIVVSEEGQAPGHNSQVYTPCARPGYLAPHAWLGDNDSLYDHFSEGFTLLAADSVAHDLIDQVSLSAEQQGIPFKVLQSSSLDVEQRYGARLVLIRPDQHIAWRGQSWEPVFAKVTGNES